MPDTVPRIKSSVIALVQQSGGPEHQVLPGTAIGKRSLPHVRASEDECQGRGGIPGERTLNIHPGAANE